jgi:phospholipid/cholesterol/gamma-HCH transport system substrate-binding protein
VKRPAALRLYAGAMFAVMLVAAGLLVVPLSGAAKVRVTAYFANTNGLYVGDEIRILGIPVGEVTAIDAEPQRVRVSFWFDGRHPVPADAKAVILSPTLVTARAIQLTPAYTGGAALPDHAVIPQARTAVPVEWDDIREQLAELTATLQPTEPGGVSTLGQFVTTLADNVRGQGPTIRDTVLELSAAVSVLGDHSGDVFSSVRSLSALVDGLSSSAELLMQLNRNLASVTARLADDPDEVGRALADLNTAAADVRDFVGGNREALGVTADRLASVSTAIVDSLDDVEQTLHISPNTAANFANVYQPAQGGISAALALNNFSNTVGFLCGAVQAASRMGAEQSAKLCVQYLAPIIKNRQYNFLPIGLNPFVGGTARPNEITYSDDRLRPGAGPPAAPPPGEQAPVPHGAPYPAEAPVPTDPQAGLPGMMTPPGGGS